MNKFTSQTNILYIQSEPGISEAEWEKLVLSTEALRLNRETEYEEDRFGEPVTIVSSGLTAEIKLQYAENVWGRSGETHFWSLCFFYSREKKNVFFSYQYDFEKPENSVRQMAVYLASKLNAKIVDDTGKTHAW